MSAAATGTDDPTKVGRWEESFSISNVACHATLLPNGKILCWSRRSDPMADPKSPTGSMNEQRTNAFLIDLKGKGGPKCSFTRNQPQAFISKDRELTREANNPQAPDNSTFSNVSIFCSGHCLMADGNLFVVGGHVEDSKGQQQACIYDYDKDLWLAKKPPRVGRWYPSALSLPDGSVLTISGSDTDKNIDQVPQIWRGDGWDPELVQSMSLEDPAEEKKLILALYPRLHFDPFGRIFMAGPSGQSMSLNLQAVRDSKTGEKRQWGPVEVDLRREKSLRENGASVTYDAGKVLWMGGGNDGVDLKVPGFVGKRIAGPPTNATATVDLFVEHPKWQAVKLPQTASNSAAPTSPNFRRRHHNLTTLPDGTVLVTGGTQGLGFNDLRDSQPVHEAALWKPQDGQWTKMAAEKTDRCYHGVALLLPDGSVLSAGGGEGGEFDAPPNPDTPNPTRDNHTDAQIYKPPYFFIKDANPPQVSGVPKEARYGEAFDVTVQGSELVGRISWIRLPSVTHGVNSSQSVFFEINPTRKGGKLTVTPPNNRYVATPGYYMLFFVGDKGRPSEATIIKILPDPAKEVTLSRKVNPDTTKVGNKFHARMRAPPALSLPELDEKVIAKADKPAVKIGITPVCPYGLGACWAGAFEGLQHVKDIDVVRPLPDHDNSVAFVYLKDDILPDLDVWRKELAHTAGGTYGELR
jgi:galactose oxidase